MNVGGVQKSLINFIHCIHKNADIYLFLFYPHGQLINDLPKDVHIMYPEKKYQIIGMSNSETKNISFSLFIRRSFIVALCRLFGNYRIVKLAIKKMNVDGAFDLAISYFQNCNKKTILFGCNDIALKILAKQHFAFVHCDPKKTKLINRVSFNEYLRFDKVFCVSKQITDYMKELVPNCNVETLYNCHLIDNILAKSDETIISGKWNIHPKFISVCRLGKEKGIERIIKVCELMEINNIKYSWLIIGDSVYFDEYNNLIIQKKIKHLYLLGEKINPYPYIKLSDYLVIASYHEAAPMVLDESLILGTQVISTEYGYARELLEDRFVCKNNDDDFVNAIFSFAKSYKNEKSLCTIFDNNTRVKKIIERILNENN